MITLYNMKTIDFEIVFCLYTHCNCLITTILGYVGHMHYLSKNGCIGVHLSFQSMDKSCFVTISGDP